MMEGTPETGEKVIGRNEPCPCGSGKKYKRCCGVGAAPKVTPPKPAAEGAASQLPFDPSKMDPASMQKVTRAMKRLPKGQLQRMQSLMQRAMAGKDVSREAADFERTLPPDFQNMMMSIMPQMMAAQGAEQGAAGSAELTEEEARRIVAEAAAEGKISEDRAENLLGAKPEEVLEKEKGGLSKLFRRKK